MPQHGLYEPVARRTELRGFYNRTNSATWHSRDQSPKLRAFLEGIRAQLQPGPELFTPLRALLDKVTDEPSSGEVLIRLRGGKGKRND